VKGSEESGGLGTEGGVGRTDVHTPSNAAAECDAIFRGGEARLWLLNGRRWTDVATDECACLRSRDLTSVTSPPVSAFGLIS